MTGGLIDQTLDFLIDLPGGLLGIVPSIGLTAPGCQERRAVSFAEIDPAKAAHAILHDHGAGDVGGPFKIVRCTGANVSKNHLLGERTSQEYLHLCLEFRLGDKVPIIFWSLHGVTQCCDSPGDDGNFVHRIGIGDRIGDQSVAGLVVSDPELFILVHHPFLFLQSGRGPFDRLVELRLVDHIFTLPCRQQSRFVDQIGKVGSDKSWGNCCDLFEFDVSAEFDVLDVYLQNVLATLLVGSVDEHVTIKSPGTKQRGV